MANLALVGGIIVVIVIVAGAGILLSGSGKGYSNPCANALSANTANGLCGGGSGTSSIGGTGGRTSGYTTSVSTGGGGSANLNCNAVFPQTALEAAYQSGTVFIVTNNYTSGPNSLSCAVGLSNTLTNNLGYNNTLRKGDGGAELTTIGITAASFSTSERIYGAYGTCTPVSNVGVQAASCGNETEGFFLFSSSNGAYTITMSYDNNGSKQLIPFKLSVAESTVSEINQGLS